MIKQITNNADKFVDDNARRKTEVILNVLNYVGMDCLKDGRLHGNYTDRTGNLRSSIGYMVLDWGKVYRQSMIEQTLEGADGQADGLAFMNKLIPDNSDGLVLIVVAGRNYAAYVEALENFNVLSHTELYGKRVVKEMINELIK
jgi:hypothetical protein